MRSKAAKRYDSGLWILEKLAFRDLRNKVLPKAEGRVLEIGIGTGVNLSHYRQVEFVAGIDIRTDLMTGIDPGRISQPVLACCADAEALPFPAHSFDSVVSTLVFCSVSEVGAALAEIKRILKPGGRMLMMEHVRGQTRLSRRLSDWLHPFWFALQRECHLNRETEASLLKAGFRITHKSTHGHGLLLVIEAEPV